MNESKKRPDTENGARSVKAYEALATFSLILGIICALFKEHELYQDCEIAGAMLELIALGKKIN